MSRTDRFVRALLVLVPLLLFANAPRAGAQILSELTLPPGGNGRSQRAEVSQWIGPVKVSIEYHSPSIRTPSGVDRTGHVWGELVPFGLFDDGHGPSRATPWRAGANESTTISFSHDVTIAGKPVRAGTYALFLEVRPNAPWQWIFSTHAGWGSYQYDPKNDVLRVATEPVPAAHTEYLTYSFDERRPASAVAYLQWEDRRVPLKIDVPDVNEIYVAEMRTELDGWPGFNYQNWATAARFCAIQKINLEEALVWADKAIHEPFRGAPPGRAEFATLETKGLVLSALGREAESDAVMDRAIAMPDADAASVYFHSWALVRAGRTARAIKVAVANRQRHPEEPYWTYLGLARAYTAAGDRPNAVQNWEAAIKNVPDFAKQDVPEFERTLRTLKERTQ